VILGSASRFFKVCIETDSLRITAWVITRIHAKVKLWNHGVEATVAKLCANKTLTTIFTVKITEPSIKFEENFSTRDVLFLSKIHHELVDVP
jgi:hypothetical protein